MGKLNRFKKGDLVSAKKINGEEILGIYEHEYDCGDHCVSTGEKKFCVSHNAVKRATPEQEEIIKETIIKPMREAKKKKALEKQQEDAIDQEEMEELASEPTEEVEDGEDTETV